jgi:myo-inositol 2-dehydrogenase/D-chiro-inositol 1-dehydrogenase
MARFIMGSDIDEVFAAAAVRTDPEIGAAGDVDTSVVVLRFKNGAIGTIDNCRKSVSGYDQRVELLGSNGTFASGGPPSRENAVQKNLAQHFIDRYKESYITELQAFVKAVREGSPVPVTGIDGRMPVALALAAQKSHDEHRSVRLAEIE